jgi:hypothetical protein
MFNYNITDDQVSEFLEDRRRIAQDLDYYYRLKKDCESLKDFELSKAIKKEIISKLDRLLKAYNIAKFILVDGMGKIPKFPVELLPELTYLNVKYR